MNARKIITLLAVVFIIGGTLYLKNNRATESPAVAQEGAQAQTGLPQLLDLAAPG